MILFRSDDNSSRTPDPNMNAPLVIQPADSQPVEVTRELIRSQLAHAVVEDVSQLEARRTGVGIRIADLLTLLPASDSASQMTMRSSDGFTASLPLEVACSGILVFEVEGNPPTSAGGPFRFFTIDSAACGTAVADNCANVKGIVSIEIA